MLSSREADELYEPFRAALADDFHYLDQALWLHCTQIEGQDIWGNVDDDETRALANILLKKGQSSPATAALVRGMVNSHDYLAVGAMFAPRIKATVKAMREAPERPKRRKFSLIRKADAA